MRSTIRPWSSIATVLLAAALWCGSTVVQPATSSTRTGASWNLGINPTIRVLISDPVTSVCVTPKTAWQVSSLSGRLLRELVPDKPTTIALMGGAFTLLTASPFVLRDGQTSGAACGADAIVLESKDPAATLAMAGWSSSSGKKRIYEGRIEVHPSLDGTFQCVTVLALEEYLRGVVPSEIGSTSPREALCAQAVAARSEAVRALTSGVYAGSHHDICASSQCQAYSGLTMCSAATDAAVSATRGWILTFEDKPLPAYYSSNCGGHTEDIRNVWPDRSSEHAYWDADRFDSAEQHENDLANDDGLRRWLQADPVCHCNPKYFRMPDWAGRSFRWTREVNVLDLSRSVAERKDIGRIREIRSVRRGRSGRLAEVEFIGETGVLTVGPELAIRRIFRPALRSSAFAVDTGGGSPGQPETFVIHGAGNGHGVGMCQTGAIGMANAGKSFRDILAHYYPNALLAKIY